MIEDMVHSSSKIPRSLISLPWKILIRIVTCSDRSFQKWQLLSKWQHQAISSACSHHSSCPQRSIPFQPQQEQPLKSCLQRQ